jgi:hypothetical protein
MKSFLTGVLLVLLGILIAGLILLTASPPRGEPVTLLPPPTPLPIIIHVEGAVTNPGVVHIPFGSRVQEALEAARGPLPQADLTNLNLAAPPRDDTQNRVPTLSTSTRETPAPNTLPEAPLNINMATVDELAALPGIAALPPLNVSSNTGSNLAPFPPSKT